MEGLADRIRTVRGRLSRRAFAESLGVTITAVQNWEGGAVPKMPMLLAICHRYSVNEEWLLHERGPMRGGFQHLPPVPTGFIADGPGPIVPPDRFVLLPLKHLPAARGRPTSPDDVPRPHVMFDRAWLEGALQASDRDLALAINDVEQNAPDIRFNDLVVVDTRVEALGRDGFYLFGRKDDLMIKWVERLVGGGYVVRARNDGSVLQTITDDEAAGLTIYGLVVWAGGLR